MNIEWLKELIELSKLLDDKNVASSKTWFEWEYIIVRWYDAGVWTWKLINWTHWNIILEDARMLRRWWTKKGIWLSSLAINWLDNTKEIKINETQKKILINDLRVSTFYICTPEVEKQIREFEDAKQS